MKITLLASLLTIGLGTTLATTTTDSLQLTVNGVTATIADNGACVGAGCTSLSGDINSANGTDTISGSIGGWTISITSGTSHSPSDIPVGLDLTSLTADCNPNELCDTHPLDVKYSDINFSPANPSFITKYSATITGTGTTSESAYFSNTNTLFAETTLIGTVGPFGDPGGSGFATGGLGSKAPFSLTLDQVFDASASGATYSVDGSVASVPEPGAVILFGTVLVLCASKLRRRRSS